MPAPSLNAGEPGSVLGSLQGFCLYNKHKEDWGHVPTFPYCILHKAQCHSFIKDGHHQWREVNYRITLASAAFGSLQASVLERRGIRLQTKLKVYCLLTLSSLLYACETWSVYSYHAKQITSFHVRYLRKLLHIKWQERIPETEILWRATMVSTHAMLERYLLRWAGHVCHNLMSACQRGCSMVSWKQANAPDTLNVALKSCGIYHDS